MICFDRNSSNTRGLKETSGACFQFSEAAEDAQRLSLAISGTSRIVGQFGIAASTSVEPSEAPPSMVHPSVQARHHRNVCGQSDRHTRPQHPGSILTRHL